MKELAHTALGRIAVEPKALERLVRDAAASVDAVGVVRAVSLDDGAVAVTITARRRAVLPELGELVQQRIAEAVQQALDVPAARVDVTIEGIQSEDEH